MRIVLEEESPRHKPIKIKTILRFQAEHEKKKWSDMQVRGNRHKWRRRIERRVVSRRLVNISEASWFRSKYTGARTTLRGIKSHPSKKREN